MKKLILIILASIAPAVVLIGPIMSKVEKPKYIVNFTEEDIESRSYDSMIVAEVLIKNSREESISQGFRVLADYIFGNNVSAEKIPMTSPVIEQKSEKIPMTAPVKQQIKDNIWSIQFIMPAQYSMDSLPKPNNNTVKIKLIPPAEYVVIKFNGKNENKNIQIHEDKLKEFIEKKDLEVKGKPIYAFYNPPWTIPILRRNEIMIEIKN